MYASTCFKILDLYDIYSQQTTQMSAFIAFGRILGEAASDIISSFLYRSQTVAGTCGENINDVANLADIKDSDVLFRITGDCYVESLETAYLPPR